MKVVKVALVTGASSGIGRALCIGIQKQCRALGIGTLVLCARSVQGLRETQRQIESSAASPMDTYVVAGDVSTEDGCRSIVDETIKVAGRLDVLVLNAGVASHTLFRELESCAPLHKLMATNYFGYVHICFFALPHLLKQKEPALLVVGSLSGELGLPGRTGYCASKFAVHGFVEALRAEFRHDALQITLVAPGFVNTNIRKSAIGEEHVQIAHATEGKKGMSADECASKILHAFRSRQEKCILTWSGQVAVWFKPWVPRIVEKIASKKAGVQLAKL